MRGTSYEALISKLAKKLKESPHLQDCRICNGRKHRIPGASGYSHQIDVALQNEDTLYLIEAKYWKKAVGVESILVLASRLQDIRKAVSLDVHASIVSTKQATKGAKTLAPHLGIKIDTVKSLQEYALQFGSQHFIGVSDGPKMGDSAEAEHLKKCPVCGNLIPVENGKLISHACAASA